MDAAAPQRVRKEDLNRCGEIIVLATIDMKTACRAFCGTNRFLRLLQGDRDDSLDAPIAALASGLGFLKVKEV